MSQKHPVIIDLVDQTQSYCYFITYFRGRGKKEINKKGMTYATGAESCDIFRVKRQHFITFCQLEGGQFIIFCLPSEHPRGHYRCVFFLTWGTRVGLSHSHSKRYGTHISKFSFFCLHQEELSNLRDRNLQGGSFENPVLTLGFNRAHFCSFFYLFMLCAEGCDRNINSFF